MTWNAYPSRSAAEPKGAKWYGEVIVGRDVPGGTATDYYYGYSDAVEAPDLSGLVPDGWTVLDSMLIQLDEF
jgi:hypothetical protein